MTSKEYIQKEIKELQERTHYYGQFENCEEFYKTYAKLRNYGVVLESLERLDTLEKENQELREYFDKIASGNTIIELFRDNHNFKKVIEIIKEKSFMKIAYSEKEKMWHFIGGNSLTNEEYELLKEVLCDVE